MISTLLSQEYLAKENPLRDYFWESVDGLAYKTGRLVYKTVNDSLAKIVGPLVYHGVGFLKPGVPRASLLLLGLLIPACLCYGLQQIRVNYFDVPVFRSWVMEKFLITRYKTSLKVGPNTYPYRYNKEVTLKHHRHPILAGIRNQASSDVSGFCKANGLVRYDVDTSNREKHIKGSHYYYTVKDILTPYKNDSIPTNAFITMIDSDYYHENFNSCLGRPMCIFTFTPSKLFGKYAESTYQFQSEDVVQLKVVGGGNFLHRVWDWDQEVAMFKCITGWWGYKINIIEYSQEHRLVYLLDPFFILDPFGWLAKPLDIQTLMRSKAERYGRYLVRLTLDAETHFQIMEIGGGRGVQVTTHTLTALMHKHHIELSRGKNGVQLDTVASLLGRKDPSSALFLHLAITSGELSTLRLSLSLGVYLKENEREIQSHGQELEDIVEKPPSLPGLQHCNPLSEGGSVVEAPNLSSEKASLAERIDDVRNSVYPTQFNKYKIEFVRLLLGGKTSIPLEREEVLENQKRPAQKARNAQVESTLEKPEYLTNADGVSKPVVKIFSKAEPIGVGKTSRLISQYTTTSCLKLSAYTYVLKKEILKRTHWYAPGWTPNTTAKRITSFTKKHLGQEINETDQSKYDGHISKWLRELEMEIYTAYFPKDNTLVKLLSDEYGAKATTKRRQVRKTSYERGSGSALTTDGNTMLLAFMVYCFWREKGYKISASWGMIGPKAGDDSLDYGNFDELSQHFKLFGMEATGKKLERDGDIGFLGRIFRVETGSQKASSICDVKRFISKAHIGMNAQVSKINSYANKILGYAVTDPKTPLVSELAALLNRSNNKFVYNNENDRDRGYTVRQGPYHNNLSEEVMVGMVAKNLGVIPEQVNEARDRVNSWNTIGDIDTLFVFENTNIKVGENGFPPLEGLVETNIKILKTLNNNEQKQKRKTNGKFAKGRRPKYT